MFNEGNQIHNFMSSSGSGSLINYGFGSDFLTSYSSCSGSGSKSQKVTVPTVPVPVPVPVPQHWPGELERCTYLESLLNAVTLCFQAVLLCLLRVYLKLKKKLVLTTRRHKKFEKNYELKIFGFNFHSTPLGSSLQHYVFKSIINLNPSFIFLRLIFCTWVKTAQMCKK